MLRLHVGIGRCPGVTGCGRAGTVKVKWGPAPAARSSVRDYNEAPPRALSSVPPTGRRITCAPGAFRATTNVIALFRRSGSVLCHRPGPLRPRRTLHSHTSLSAYRFAEAVRWHRVHHSYPSIRVAPHHHRVVGRSGPLLLHGARRAVVGLGCGSPGRCILDERRGYIGCLARTTFRMADISDHWRHSALWCPVLTRYSARPPHGAHPARPVAPCCLTRPSGTSP